MSLLQEHKPVDIPAVTTDLPEELVVMPKLSTIFRRASVELKQVRNKYGLRSQRTACAIGAIRFFLGDNNENLGSPINKPNTPEFQELKRQMDLLDKHLNTTYKTGIIGMNDGYNLWSFANFAEECEKLGI